MLINVTGRARSQGFLIRPTHLGRDRLTNTCAPGYSTTDSIHNGKGI